MVVTSSVDTPPWLIAGAIGLACGFGLGHISSGRRTGQNYPKDDIRTKAAEDLIKTTKDIIQYQPSRKLDHVARLEARSGPNERLKIVFGIDNIFTTTDAAWATEFRRQAVRKLIAASVDDWKPLISTIRQTTDFEAERLGKMFRVDVLIRNVVCRVSLEYLFDLKSNNTTPRVVENVASAINELWIVSKNLPRDGVLEPQYKQQKEQLLHDLHDLIDFDEGNPRENPLNFLLPAYETMWRVVKMGFQELYWRGENVHGPDVVGWQQRILDHLQTGKGFSNDGGDELCAKDIIREILRLYPPARRVYRHFSGDDDNSIADLEKCHRNFKLAGNNSNEFDPSRWIEIRKRKIQGAMNRKLKDFEGNDLGFLPFARRCPAGTQESEAFGFKMISFLIGALLEVAKTREFKFDEECLPKHVPLLAGRTLGDGSLMIAKVVERQDNAGANITRRDGGSA